MTGPLSGFTVELDVYSGPYEWLLALILREELDILEVPLRELVGLYLRSRDPRSPQALRLDTEFVGSASALVLLKSRTLLPLPEEGEEAGEEPASPEELAERLGTYLKVRRAAEALRSRLEANAGHHPSAHEAPPRPGRQRVDRKRLLLSARRVFSRLEEPPVEHLGPITVTVQELAALILASLSRGPVSYEELTRGMDRLRSAVAFAAALSLAHEGSLRLRQPEPLGPLTLERAG
ncbi:condensin subunit ScpA [Rubrobacter xylanophilus DSM 9941]|uniref:Segregation and condensation protein A n=1 Tax=Rubrobacter xylanophilus (strain DSM 9941 / JCM 11954 / NBRC 16129 / PRD-1) TaxID=266117 RepID=Q1AW22_RUBXD|nr:segregation/condensation protein A [Rubrobacter xylanophilus]ABG04406.1 condensin subunit ScpA [Rubrobacter xylanophilus DSM 9941]